MTEEPQRPSYEVGYKKPPKATQFRPGKSGNPKGRPKGTSRQNMHENFFKEVLDNLYIELGRQVVITENGRAKSVNKLQLIAIKMCNEAVTNVRSRKALFDLVNQHFSSQAARIKTYRKPVEELSAEEAMARYKEEVGSY